MDRKQNPSLHHLLQQGRIDELFDELLKHSWGAEREALLSARAQYECLLQDGFYNRIAEREYRYRCFEIYRFLINYGAEL